MKGQLNSVFDMDVKFEFIEVDSDGILASFYHYYSLISVPPYAKR